LTEKAANLDAMFLGAGHADWKIEFPTKKFLECCSRVMIADLSDDISA
jgi:hypothetical protein